MKMPSNSHQNKLLAFFILLLITLKLYPQVELIPNGDFEKHAPIITLNSHLFFGKFDASLPGWTCYNTGPHICDKNYKKSAEEVLKQRACNPPKAGYHSYTTALELNYNKDMVSDDRSHVGYSTYIGCKLNSRLEIGKIYLLSFWVYVFEEARTSPEAHNYLGFKLQTQPKHSKYRVMDKKPTKFLKNLEKEKWQEVRFYIRSLCELEYLKIGYFATEQWPVQDFSPIHVDSSTLDNRVWIDLVSLKEVNEKDVPHEITPTPYCREMETDDKNETISLAPEYLYFAENASTLTAAQEKTLDSIVRFVIQKNPTKVFDVIGHTDNQGSKQKNKVLSEQRAENVKSYLLNKHRLPFWRFSRSGLADDFAVADNSTSEGKSQNRRVEIRASVYEPSMFIYDNILALAARKQLDSAFAMTGLWLRAAPQKKQILLLVDPRASTLRTNFKKWRHLYKEVKKGYSRYEDPNSAFLLDSFYFEDQRYRTLRFELNSISVDSVTGADLLRPLEDFTLGYSLDSGRLEAYLKANKGKPYFRSIDDVGERAARFPVFALLHSPEILKYEYLLPELEASCKKGENEWFLYAFLFDRIALRKGKPQRFGTQMQTNPLTGKMELGPIEDEVNLKARRQAIGLD